MIGWNGTMISGTVACSSSCCGDGLAMAVSPDDFPAWVPAAVKKLALQLRFEEELILRLVTDIRMKSIWQYLNRRSVQITDPDPFLLIEFFGVAERGVPSSEKACAVFFFNLVFELSFRQATTLTHTEVSNIIKSLQTAAEQCRLAITDCDLRSGELTAALNLVSKFFDSEIDYLTVSSANNPYILSRKSNRRDDDTVHGRVRALALLNRNLYGQYLYTILATVATVAVETNVTIKDVRNWCKDL
jgi:hypothetical protein